MTRLPTGLLVSALMKRTNDSGGFAVVRAKGDAHAGGMLVLLEEGQAEPRVVERGIGPSGKAALIDSTPGGDVEGYWRRRRRNDPDLWVIELAGPDAQRFVAETILDD